MEKRAGVCLLLCMIINPAVAEVLKSYFKDGGTMVLRPHQVSAPITAISWKHMGNLLGDWEKGDPGVTFYSSFKGRAKLNTSTGVLEISNMNGSYSGEYVVQINLKDQVDTYDAVMIKQVPKPKVFLQPLACGPHLQSCSLKCDGDIKGAEPVTYHWNTGDGDWTESEEVKNIANNQQTQRIKTFSCKVENPISTEESTPFDNPFFQEPKPTPGPVDVVGPAVGGVFGVCVVVVALVLMYRYREFIFKWFSGLRRNNRTTNPENGASPAKEGGEATALKDNPNASDDN